MVYCKETKQTTDAFPELAKYDSEGYYEIVHAGTADEAQGTYEIIFDINGRRYYCITAAHSLNEALGLFFREHPHITYNIILEHMEV